MISLPVNTDPAKGDTPKDPNLDASHIARDPKPPEASRAALVKKLQGGVTSAKKHWAKKFKQMRADMLFLSSHQWEEEGPDSTKYVANITQRHVQQRVASLYAKNPKAVCRRRKTLDFAVWDETSTMLQGIEAAMAASQQTGMPIDLQVTALMQDVSAGVQKRQMLDRISKTLEIVFAYQVRQQNPPFKKQFKQLIRRVLATSVGYIKLGFQRYLEKRPEDVEKITDVTQQIVKIEALLADLHDDELDKSKAEVEQLRLMLNDLQAKPDVIVKEGLVFDFPRSTSIIVDPRCTDLNGFLGAQWVAQEFILEKSEVKEIYNIDLGKSYTQYIDPQSAQPGDTSNKPDDDTRRGRVCVWELYHKTDNMCYVIAEGHADFLKEPSEPDIQLERFWPFFALTFNQVEQEESIFPDSDIQLIRPMQKEYNRCKQGQREHRIANRPKTAVAAGVLEQADREKLESHPANAVLEIQGLLPGVKISDVLQPINGPAITRELYDTTDVFEDTLRVLGSQEANLGGEQGDVTATQSSIAESSRVSALSSNIDDIDDMFTELAEASGAVLLRELSSDTVTKIAGPGAVWPEMTANEIAQELYLEIEAGSSGRPNKAADIANFEKLAPILLQLPGLSPEWLIKETVKRLDDNLDPSDAILSAAASIVATNANKQLATGNPATDPTMQQGQPNTPPPGGPSAPPVGPGPGMAGPPPGMVHAQQ